MYVYIRSQPGLFTVGFYDPQGKWQAESDHTRHEEAADRVHYLNGGRGRFDFTPNGVPILTLDEKVKALHHCLYLPDPKEDAVGHLCDLLNYAAPGYKITRFQNAAEIVAYYGKNPAPIRPDFPA